MIIVGLSVVVTVIVLQYHHHDPDGGKMPKWVRSSDQLTMEVGLPHPSQYKATPIMEAWPLPFAQHQTHHGSAYGRPYLLQDPSHQGD